MSTFGFLRRSVERLYHQFQQTSDTDYVDEVRAVLTNTPVFQSCSYRTLGALAASMHRRTYQPGEVLYYERDPGLGLYVIEHGQVRLSADWEQERMDMRVAGPNDLFGALSLVGDFRRMETAEATTEVRVLGLFQPDLDSLTQRRPQAAIEILQALTQLLATQYIELIDIIADRDGEDIALQSYAQVTAQTNRPADD